VKTASSISSAGTRRWKRSGTTRPAKKPTAPRLCRWISSANGPAPSSSTISPSTSIWRSSFGRNRKNIAPPRRAPICASTNTTSETIPSSCRSTRENCSGFRRTSFRTCRNQRCRTFTRRIASACAGSSPAWTAGKSW